MGFKKMRGVKLSEAAQGLIRYTCLTYGAQEKGIQAKIDTLCEKICPEDPEALKEVMCTHKGIRTIAVDHFISERTLYRRRKEFYESW